MEPALSAVEGSGDARSPSQRGTCCSLFGVRRRAPGHGCPARNSTPLSRLYDVIPSAARCLRSGRVCGARDLLFPFLECGGGLRAMGARRETRRRFPASTMSSRAQRVVCAPDVFAERGICCFPLGVRRRAPGHRCPARNSTPLSRLYDVIPSAARDLLLVSWSLPRPCRGASAFSSPVVILRGRSPEEPTPRLLPIRPSM